MAKDTDEVQFSARRRRFLVDQGYEFHVISDYSNMIPREERATLQYYTERDQYELLNIVKRENDEAGLDEELEVGADDLAAELKQKKAAAPKTEKEPVKQKAKTSLFKAWHRGR